MKTLKPLRTFTSLALCGLLLTGCTFETAGTTQGQTQTGTNDSSQDNTNDGENESVKSYSEEEFVKTFNSNLTNVFNSEIYQDLLSSYDELGALEDGTEVFKVALEMNEHLGESVNVIPQANIKFHNNQMKFAYELISGKVETSIPNYVTTENINKVNHLLDLVTYANYAKDVSMSLANMENGVAVDELKFGSDGQANVKLIEGESKSSDGVLYINQAALYVELGNKDILMSPTLIRPLAYYQDVDGKPYLDTFGDAASKISESAYVDFIVDYDMNKLIREITEELESKELDLNAQNINKALDGRTINNTLEDTEISNGEDTEKGYFISARNPRGNITKENYVYRVQDSYNNVPAASVGRQDFDQSNSDVKRFSFMWNFVGTSFYSKMYENPKSYKIAEFDKSVHEDVSKEFDELVKDGYHKEDKYTIEEIGDTIYKVSIKPIDGMFADKGISSIFDLKVEENTEEAVG